MPTKDPIGGNIELEEDDAPDAVGQIRLVGGSIFGRDDVGTFNLRASAAGAEVLCLLVLTNEGGVIVDNDGQPILREAG